MFGYFGAQMPRVFGQDVAERLRSPEAPMYLRSAGYQATNLLGGMRGWRGPLER